MKVLGNIDMPKPMRCGIGSDLGTPSPKSKHPETNITPESSIVLHLKCPRAMEFQGEEQAGKALVSTGWELVCDVETYPGLEDGVKLVQREKRTFQLHWSSSITLLCYHLLRNEKRLPLHMVTPSEYIGIMLSFITPTFYVDLISKSSLFRTSKLKRLISVLSLTSQHLPGSFPFTDYFFQPYPPFQVLLLLLFRC